VTTELDADARAELHRRAHAVIDSNKYMTLATADRTGTPWVTPVYFTPDGTRRFLWVSSPEAQHSVNLTDRPEVAITVYDSSVPIGGAQAIYTRAMARLVATDELEPSAALYSGRLPELTTFTAADLTDPGPFRLYEAVLQRWWLLIPGRDMHYGSGIDRRVELDPPGGGG
jgi:uncharacterized protein YhbP (UPF0306 family)